MYGDALHFKTLDLIDAYRPTHGCQICMGDYSSRVIEWQAPTLMRRMPKHKELEHEVMKNIFIIGYGGLDPSAWLALLRQHGIQSVVDIRIWPTRRAWVRTCCRSRRIDGFKVY
jgi:hypothetical protein